MSRALLTGVALSALLLGPAGSFGEEVTAAGVTGTVSSRSGPLAQVTVYAYEIAKLSMEKVLTDGDGRFVFDTLPAGVYKIVALKDGFEPAVLMLSRAAREARQFLEVELIEADQEGAGSESSYWAVRDQVPPDVLHDIQIASREDPWERERPLADRTFRTALQATTGVGEFGSQTSAQFSGAEVGVEGSLGSLQVDLSGEFWRLDRRVLATPEPAVASPEGQAASFALSMEGAGRTEVDVTTLSHRLPVPGQQVAPLVDFSRYQLRWSHPLGERSRSEIRAQYVDQSNFYRRTQVAPAEVPAASRSLDLEGSYALALSDRGSLETSVRYRELLPQPLLLEGMNQPQRAIELFGKAGWKIQPSVLVEYGIFTRMQDGSFSLAPQGSVVVQLGSGWQAETMASRRVQERGQDLLPYFNPTRFSHDKTCGNLEQHCYRLVFSHHGDDGQLFEVGAVDRRYAETLQLYFDDDFFDQLESLFMVRGDEIPELQFVLSRRVTPQVLARLESNVASGGGGILYAADRSPYQNRVRYLVTSLDTQFEQSSTGVFLAFHHLEQELDPLGPAGAPSKDLATDRLQLMLTQDLDILASLAADWAVHFNVELSRGNPFADSSEERGSTRRKISGGLTVKF